MRGKRWLPAYVNCTQREWKSRKRQELREVKKALDVLRVGCALTPFYLEFDAVAEAINRWRKQCAVENWR